MARVASARRHAQAVFQLAQDLNQVEAWRSDLKTIAATLTDPHLLAILEDPKVHLSDKVQLAGRCLPDVSQLALNFAYLLVARQRLGIAEQLVAEYEHMADAHQGVEHVRVTTAVPIDEEVKAKLTKRLADMTGRRVVLSLDVDSSIIGGFVTRIGDKLIDGSIKAKLESLKKELVEAPQ